MIHFRVARSLLAKKRLAFVCSYQGFENALICKMSIGLSVRFRPILNFPIFREN